MPPPPRPWFRVYCEIVTDPKVRRLTPTQRWIWVAVLAAARTSPVSGTLLLGVNLELTADDLASYSGVRRRDAVSTLKLLEELGMLYRDPESNYLVVTSWSQRQYESDDSTPRSGKTRSLQRPNDVASTSLGEPLQLPKAVATNGVATRPEQSRAETEQSREDDLERSSSSDQNKTVATPAVVISFVDDLGEEEDRGEVFEKALRILVAAEAERQIARGNPPRSPAWTIKAIGERRVRHEKNAAAAIRARPHITAQQLANELEPPAHPARARSPAVANEVQRLTNLLAGLRMDESPDFDTIRETEEQLDRVLRGDDAIPET